LSNPSALSASALESLLLRNWQRRGPLARLLWPLSLLFRALVGLRRGLYRRGWLASGRLDVPVIVVGNIFIGGTGKTPLTIWLVEALRRRGYHPGVISRGYGGKQSGDGDAAPRQVLADSSPASVGDEPLLIALRAQCPVMVGRDRVAAGRALLAAQPEVDIIISDDGLQHYALQRQVELLLFDARGVGNGWTLPAGPLREPVTRTGDFTLLNAVQPTPQLIQSLPGRVIAMQLSGDSAERLSDPGQRLALGQLPAVRITAAAGIGNPERFFSMLRAAGVVFDALPLADHYDFSDNPFVGCDAEIILITEKDAVKCKQIDLLKNDPRLWVVPVTARIDEALVQQIVEKCGGCPIT
jgi:tetraacyldisaccharide 4'-kinase